MQLPGRGQHHGAIPSGFAPGSEVKSSGERVLPYTPQPMPTPSSTDATNAAASKPNSVRFARDLSAGICAGALDLQVGHQTLQVT